MTSLPEETIEMIQLVNKVVHASRQEARETGREPTPEALAEKLDLPLEKLRRVMDIATMKVRAP